MRSRRLRRYRWFLLPAALAVGLYLYPRPVLYPFGAYLIKADEPVRCDCLLVLAGDNGGQRILHAAELFRAGMASKIFVSGPEGNYGHTDDELAIAFAKEHGAGDVPFIGLPNTANSTVSEVRELIPRLRAADCRSVMLVTSNYHTRRSGRIARREWPEMEVRVAAAPSIDFDPNAWWTNRKYQKTFFFEWTKTVADWIGL